MELVIKLPLFEEMPYFYKYKELINEENEQFSADMKVCFIYNYVIEVIYYKLGSFLWITACSEGFESYWSYDITIRARM